MTKEILKTANDLADLIERTRSEGNQMAVLLNEVKDNKIRARVCGFDFVISKAVFKAEVRGKKDKLDAQLVALEAEFNAL